MFEFQLDCRVSRRFMTIASVQHIALVHFHYTDDIELPTILLNALKRETHTSILTKENSLIHLQSACL